MPQEFDPYHRWLGIQPKDHPPNLYRLLGIELFESDAEVIRDAAEQRMGHVRTYALGKHSAVSQKILNELAVAKTCLLIPEKKSAYDRKLRGQIDSAAQAGAAAAAARETPGNLLRTSGRFDARPGRGTSPGTGLALPNTPPLARSAAVRPQRPAWRNYGRWPVWATGGAACLLLVALGTWLFHGGTTAPEQPHEQTATPSPIVPPLKDIAATGPSPSSPNRLKMPKGAILLMTFENSTLLRKDGKIYVDDLSGNGHLGEVRGARIVPGMAGSGIEFDGSSSVAIAGPFPAGVSPRTISAWIRCDFKRECIVLFYGVTEAGRAFGIQQRRDGVWAQWGHLADLRTKVDADNLWHHHALTYDGQNVTYFFDGRVAAQGAPKNSHRKKVPLNTAPEPLLLGRPPDMGKNGTFIGKLDELAVFDRVLTTEEIDTLYRMGIAGENLQKSTWIHHGESHETTF